MKRFIAAGSAVVATAAFATPALAGGHHDWGKSGDVKIVTITSQSNSGTQVALMPQKSVVVQKGGGFGFTPSAGLALSANLGSISQGLVQSNK